MRADLLVMDCDCFFSLLVYYSFGAFSISFLCSSSLSMRSVNFILNHIDAAVI